uniref:porin family protein n=1 Tax=uncultured Draconibacterium sp. TaxID=1573823 RepID=UPI003216A2A5
MMKRILTTVVLILMTLTGLNAQDIKFGVKSGLGFASIQITNLPNSEINSDIFSPTMSYSFNGTFSYKSKGLWGISFEPGLIKKGWISNKEENNENRIRLQYFQLPVLSDFYFSDKLYFSIGPEINYLLNAKNKSNNATQKITDLNRKLELSGVVGGAYKVSDILDIGIRYSHGLTQISDKVFWVTDDFNENPKELKDYNHYLQFFIQLKVINLR